MKEDVGDKAKKDEFSIFVNTRPKTWGDKTISFKEVVELAYGAYEDNPDVSYSVTYTDGPEPKPEGSLVHNKSVRIQNRMSFHVKRSNKS